MKTLLVTPAPANSLHFANLLGAQCGGPVMRATQCGDALQRVSQDNPGLVIVDEGLRDVPAREFIRQIMQLNAFVNVAVMSSLAEEEFHEVYEGLGVLAKLPPRPGLKDAQELMAKYRQVAGAA